MIRLILGLAIIVSPLVTVLVWTGLQYWEVPLITIGIVVAILLCCYFGFWVAFGESLFSRAEDESNSLHHPTE